MSERIGFRVLNFTEKVLLIFFFLHTAMIAFVVFWMSTRLIIAPHHVLRELTTQAEHMDSRATEIEIRLNHIADAVDRIDGNTKP